MTKLYMLLSILLSSQLTLAITQKEAIYVNCGGDFDQFKRSFKEVAIRLGYSDVATNMVLNNAYYDANVIVNSQRKGVFKQNFSEFYNKRLDQGVLVAAKTKLKKNIGIFQQAEDRFGVSKEVLVVFWGLETSFGGFQGDFNTVSSLATLSYDCSRPQLFQPQLLAAIELTQRGWLDPRTSTGAWAGEIGQFQFLPQNIIDFGVDGDGDGVIDLKNSVADAVLSAAKMLQFEGWRTSSPWIEEVQLDADSKQAWSYSGFDFKLSRSEWNALGVRDNLGGKLKSNPTLTASLIAPEGHTGSVFLVYENFDVFLKWNQSLIYTLSAANLANSLVPGIVPLHAKTVTNGLTSEQLVRLQKFLQRYGYDVGEADGVLGAGTRAAVKDVQKQNNLIQDGWPTIDLYQGIGL